MSKPNEHPNCGIHIGNDRGSVEAAVDGIMKIVSAPCGDNVKIAALEALKSVSTFTAHSVTVSSNTLNNAFPAVGKKR